MKIMNEDQIMKTILKEYFKTENENEIEKMLKKSKASLKDFACVIHLTIFVAQQETAKTIISDINRNHIFKIDAKGRLYGLRKLGNDPK